MTVISNIRIGLSILIFVSLSLPLAGQNTQVYTQPDITPIFESVIKSDSILHSGPYRLDKNREVLLLGSGAVMSLTGLTLMNNVTPLTQQEIAQLDPNDINSFDRKSIGRYRDSNSGDALLYASFLLPLTFLANDHTTRDWKVLGVIGAEVLLLQTGLNTIVKSLVQRTRPYVYDPDTPMDKKTSKDARVSYYSGHTGTTAAMTFYVAKVYSDYLSNTTTKTLIWAGAAVYPAAVAFLRRDSGHHFNTDVISGYLIGATIGYFIPELHKFSQNEHLSLNCIRLEEYTAIELSFKF